MPSLSSAVLSPVDQKSTYIRMDDPSYVNVLVDTKATLVWPWVDVKVGTKNPGWLGQIVAGRDASSYYSRRETRFSQTPSQAEVHYDFGPAAWLKYQAVDLFSWVGPHPNPSGVTDATLRDIALSRIKRRINNSNEGFKALVPLLELRDLRRTVNGAVALTTDLIESLIEIKRTRGRSAFRYASKAWLTFGFGISPILRDIDNLSKSITAFLTKEGHVDRVVGTASKEWITQSTGDAITGAYLAPVRYTTRAQHSLSYRFIAGWRFSVNSATGYGAASHFGFTLPELVPALWEATAFSWVADYFGTIGAYLDDVFVGQAGESVYVLENRSYRVSSISTMVHYSDSPNALFVRNVPGIGTMDSYDFERTPQASLPPRILRWKTTDEIGIFAVTKLLNLASILGSK